MPRGFSKSEAKQLIQQHENILNTLSVATTIDDRIKKEVEETLLNYTANDVLELMKNISVDELNRGKKGIRTKLLRDNGYTTVYDVAVARPRALVNIKGISEDGAKAILQETNILMKEAAKGVKVKINADNKTPEGTALVVALDKYFYSTDINDQAEALLSEHRDEVKQGLLDLMTATGSFKWIFSSSTKKENAKKAYENLSQRLGSEYKETADKLQRRINEVSAISAQTAWEDFTNYPIRFYYVLEELAPAQVGNGDSLYGLPEYLAKEIQAEPLLLDGLKITLRKYQEWGVKYALHQQRVLLGDEMGLGKTCQAIAAMVSLRNQGATHFMVVCPASVLSNWCREVVKMSDLTVMKIHGANKEEALANWKHLGGVAVTTYETTGALSLEDEFEYEMLVVDEAHYIKNEETIRRKNVRTISEKAKRLLFMTGTALENRVEEMISLISVLQPSIASEVQGMEALVTAPIFREKVMPVYYRRKREDVLTELPDLIESQEWCIMGKEETRRYEQAVLEHKYTEARRVSWNIDDMNQSSKAQRLLELVKEAEEDGRKILIFSFFLDTIAKISNLLGESCMPPINGSVTPQRRQEIIDEFDKAPAGSVLVAQIQSGGTGLNIQSASVVILCEPQFKPSIENQAIARSYRMGQTRNVLVYRLLCDDTVDEKIMELLYHKQEIFDAFADQSDAATGTKELDDTRFGVIMKEEEERILEKNKAGNNSESKTMEQMME